MPNLHTAIAVHGDGVPDEHHKQAGQPVSGPIGDDHKGFLETIFGLLDSGEVDPFVPQSLVKSEVYDALDEEWQDKVDFVLLNMANQLRLIDNLRQTGDHDSIHLHTMVEQLWEMTKSIEEHHDVFKF